MEIKTIATIIRYKICKGCRDNLIKNKIYWQYIYDTKGYPLAKFNKKTSQPLHNNIDFYITFIQKIANMGLSVNGRH